MRRLLAPANAALAVLAVVAVVLFALAIQKQNAPPPSAAALTGAGRSVAGVPPSQQPSVAFVGDGYTSGSPAGGRGAANYTTLLAGRDGWRVTNVSVYGSGYVAGATLDAQVPGVVAAAPQLVVVSGGRADAESDPGAVRDAAGRLYQDIRIRFPQARIVVIGPMWLGGDAPRRMSDVRDAIRDAASVAQLPFVDPIADRWFEGRDQDGITPDGQDLNDVGHQRLAQLVDDALTRTRTNPG